MEVRQWIYCSLYNTYIRSGFELLREGNEAEAKRVYIRMVQLLASKYDISIDPQIASQIGQGKA